MTALSERFPEHRYVVAGLSRLARGLDDKFLARSRVKFVTDQTYRLLRYAEGAVVCSGTATLETALIGTPEVVCYRMDEFSYRVARAFVKIGFISLVNIIMKREVVRELIQHDMTVENAATELKAIMKGGEKHDRMMTDYAELQAVVGGEGASDRFAARMVAILKGEK
jgi:lipid-A-disaccharide synthase